MTAMSSAPRSTGDSCSGRSAISVHQAGVVDNPALSAHFVGAGAGLVGEAGCPEQRLGAAVGQVVGHLPRLEQRVHRDRDGAAIDDPVERDGECGRIGQHHADPVPRFDSGLLEQRRHPGGRRVELSEGELQVVATQRNAIGVALCGCEEIGAQAGHGVPLRIESAARF